MKSIKKRSHTKDELIIAFDKDNFKEEYFSAFLEYYIYAFNELYEDHKDWKDEDFEDDSVRAMAIRCTLRYIMKYIHLIESGHCKQWAHLVADSEENLERTLYNAYSEIKSKNPEQAKKELLAYCKSIEIDELFTEKILYEFEEGGGFYKLEDYIDSYMTSYKVLISQGKSLLYAHHYSWLIAGNFNEIYCKEYAYAYEKATNENRSLEYVEEYANRYGTVVVDIKGRYGISDDDEMLEFAIDRVNGNMKAWEYAKKNNLSKVSRFIKIHEPIYLNSYYPDEANPIVSSVDFDKAIIDKAMIDYNRLEDG